jgi:hypothetical protein
LRSEVSIYIGWYTRNRMHNPMIKIKIILFLGSKVGRVRRADNLTAIYEPTV